MAKTCLFCGVEFEGSAQAKFHSDACRKAYARRADPDLPVVDVAEAGLEEPVVREPLVTLERYVEDIVAAALRFSITIGEDDAPFEIAPKLYVTNRRKDRLERARRYAEWRWAGFRSGEVASL